MKLLLQLSLFLLPLFGYSQAGTTINYTDALGPLVLDYNGLVNGKHSYSTTVDNLTISWSGTQWEITCCGSSLLFTSATLTAMNPPNLAIGNWVDLLNNNLTELSGSGTTGNILPVKLIDFFGDTGVGHNQIRWSTASEINNEGFEIQRSMDGNDFRKVGWVKGQGNSSNEIEYKFFDKGVVANVEYYYRLKQVDLDGRYEYSDIIKIINRDESKIMVSDVFPNPSSGNLVNLNISTGTDTELNIQLFDPMGKIVLQSSRKLNEGSNHIELNINDVPNGSYFVKVEGNDFTTYKRLVISK